MAIETMRMWELRHTMFPPRVVTCTAATACIEAAHAGYSVFDASGECIVCGERSCTGCVITFDDLPHIASNWA